MKVFKCLLLSVTIFLISIISVQAMTSEISISTTQYSKGTSFISNLTNIGAIDIEESSYIMCGDTSIPAPIPPLIRIFVVLLKIATPLIIIIMGSLDFIKAVIATKEDEITKSRNHFIKRLIAGALVFLVISVTQLALSAVADNSSNDLAKCLDCLVTSSNYCVDGVTPFE